MKVVLISTYELGHQPFGLASPAAWLRARDIEVVCFDLSRESFREDPVHDADLVAFYVPMHTATRLAAQLVEPVRNLNPLAHLCFYGLYAPVNESYLRGLGIGTIIGGEFERALTDLALRLAKTSPEETASPASPSASAAAETPDKQEPVISLERLPFIVPDRAGLPALRDYAHLLLPDGGFRIAGYTEASRGCKHLCRHCPIVPVYDGAFRIVPRDVVLEDIRRQVAAGAEHITFGDPDFFNGPAHALPIIEQFHREFPRITYDVTIKIEHLLRHAEHLETLHDTGCLFVTSAVESVDDAILDRLDKGHTRADFLRVASRFRELNMALQPTFVPFTPWDSLAGYRDLLRVLAENDLIENVAPIQLGIRLLIPAGSRLLDLEEVRGLVAPFDAAALAWPWRHADPRVDALAARVQELAAAGDKLNRGRTETFALIWQTAHEAAGISAAESRLPMDASATAPRAAIPHFTEPWYCCAEPTQDQFVSIGIAAAPRAPASVPAKPSLDTSGRPDAYV